MVRVLDGKPEKCLKPSRSRVAKNETKYTCVISTDAATSFTYLGQIHAPRRNTFYQTSSIQYDRGGV